jgi:long-chain acyl-CoA synthetase
MQASRPFAWEKSYPAQVSWDAPIHTGLVTDLLDRAVDRFSGKPAITFMGRTISYLDLGRHVSRTAAALEALGIGPGDAVALFFPNTPWHPVFFFALLKRGARVVHISPLDAEREIAHKLKDSGARMLVTTDLGPLAEGAGRIKSAGLVSQLLIAENRMWTNQGAPITEGPGIVSVMALLDAAPPSPKHNPPLSATDVALLQYTGGTTGLAKAAMLRHSNLTAAVSIYLNWAEPQGLVSYATEKIICVLPLFHIFALTGVLLLGLQSGSEILMHPRFDAAAVIDDIERRKATRFSGVPTMWIAIANFPGIEHRDLSSLKSIASGGAACPVEIENRISSLTGQRLGGGWGMTETSPAGTNIPSWCKKSGTIGLPLPGIEMDIVAIDEPRRHLGSGEIGEIRIKGPNVIKGYWNKPDENEKAFVDGYLLTGDIGYMDADGYFFIVDRKKDMIISGGFNVYPRTIEEAIYEHPAVAEVSVIGIPDQYRGEAAKAFVALKPGQLQFTLDELRAFLTDKIGKHEQPAALEFMASLPKTPVGKLSKKELVAAERAKAQAAQGPHRV